jgi:hypothetical protein
MSQGPNKGWYDYRLIRLPLFLICFLLSGVIPVAAFSPHENYLLSGRTTHVGLLAEVRPGGERDLFAALHELKEGEPAIRLARVGISDVPAYYRKR